MPWVIDARIDALFVEGPDDGALVNALVKKALGLDLARRPYLVRTREEGGGDAWALGEFERYIATERPGARVGLIVDRDAAANGQVARGVRRAAPPGHGDARRPGGRGRDRR